MNELQIFDNPEFGEIRGLMIDGEPWFVGKDVAGALGYGAGKSLANAVANHVDAADKGVTKMMTPGGMQDTTIINESGLYSLIFSSKLPTAKRFKHWVTSEVLPAIRRTGKYEMEALARYAPTRPLTTDDYEDAARTISKCHNSRLPLVIDLYRKAGLDIQKIQSDSTEETPLAQKKEQRKADLMKLLSQYSLNDLCEKLPFCRTSIQYYRIGKFFPRGDGYEKIIRILEG